MASDAFISRKTTSRNVETTGVSASTRSIVSCFFCALFADGFGSAGSFSGRIRMAHPTQKARIVSQLKCLRNSLNGTPAMLQAMIMPGMIGLENSKMWRNQKLTADLCSCEIDSSSESSSTIGAENRAPPREGNRPRNAGISASSAFALEKTRRRALTMPDNVPLVRSSISRHMTKYSANKIS